MELRRDACPTCHHDPMSSVFGNLVSLATVENRTETPDGTILVRWPAAGRTPEECDTVRLSTDPANGDWERRVAIAALSYYRSRRADIFEINLRMEGALGR